MESNSSQSPANASPPAPAVVRLDLSYDGGGFHGWQVQPGLRTVQGELMRCLKKLLPLEGIPPGAGRTDAGVHARGQVASFPLPDPSTFERIHRALPRMVSQDMAVRRVLLADPDFHARHSARGRIYTYRIMLEHDPLRRRTHYFVPSALQIEKMKRAAQDLLRDDDYTSFCKASSVVQGKTRCKVRRAELVSEGPVIVFTIEADRFLHSMVRTIVGTLVEIGRGIRPVDAIPQILHARSREQAGHLAPAHGLCLEEVKYGHEGRRGLASLEKDSHADLPGIG
ncbi:MAG TPA: tRNA pseudouridine(38-40) synthase TruA [Candidatus Krumholzibacteria bacterium]|nr:tRNA pseudouridine(38-40) synthase TruA [Candidatus Krumholzibacteria bacterium]